MTTPIGAPLARSASVLATAAFGAAAFLAGGLLDTGAVSARPPAAAKPPAAIVATAPDCVVQVRPPERSGNLHPRTHRQRERLAPLAV